MPGNPKKRAVLARLKLKGGDPWLWDQIESGVPVVDLAKILETSRGQLYQYLKADPERHARFLEARATSAHALVEDATQIVDETEGLESRGAIMSAKERAGHRRWLAERYNRPDYGTPDANLNLTVNLASLHLSALQSSGSPSLPIPMEAKVLPTPSVELTDNL